jgi:hypothetical protein
MPSFEVGPLERQTRPPAQQENAPERVAHAPPPAPAEPAPLVTMSDESVIRALDTGRAAFQSCWRRAMQADPMLDVTKVKVRVELDAVANVQNVTTDAPSPKLGNCLMMVARGLSFSAVGQPAVAEFPLFFQPE